MGTFCRWKDAHINIIDTPGHVDFTIEVERALRVLDGGILVLCGVSGVQSQSLTVDRQMKRYGVPRLAFVNKLDRQGSNPYKVIGDLRSQLKLNAAAVQVPIGLEDKHVGIYDLIENKGYTFQGGNGEIIEEVTDLSDDVMSLIDEKREELIEKLADVDEEIAEIFLCEEIPSTEQMKAAIRRQTIARQFVPVFMGSAFKNKGVQPLLDGVLDYLPQPTEKINHAFDVSDPNSEKQVVIEGKDSDPLLALAFKLEDTKFGQLTYIRVYSGTLKKGGFIYNVKDGKKVKVPRIVRMHSDDMEDVQSITSGEVGAMFGIECASMDTFSDGPLNLAMSSMYVPEPVMSLAVSPTSAQKQNTFAKALGKFTKEDPTFRVKIDPDTNETILSGMGELHLDVYIERMKREFDLECKIGQPSVNYKETIHNKATFDYLLKKQSGGQGQYARVIGYIEPLTDTEESSTLNEFDNQCTGTNIPPEYYQSCAKGMNDAMAEGALIGAEVQGLRCVLQDGAAHAVDSSDMAFRSCMAYAIRDTMIKAKPAILEPIMNVEVEIPTEFQGSVVAALNKRNGMIQSCEVNEDGGGPRIVCDVPLASMFGFSTELRSSTQGKGEFTMEYLRHDPVARDAQESLVKKHQQEKQDAA